MDEPIVTVGEFIPADKEVKIQKPGKESRQYVRMSLRDNDQQDILFASDGVTVSLLKKGYLLSKKLGIANIKNIGLGGAGLISRSNLKAKQTIYISIDGEDFPIQVMHVENISHKLNFIGAKWAQQDKQQIVYIINKIYNLSRSPRK
ncbi:hypothetical protein ACVBKF_15520 [Shewanella sp. 0m-11]